MTKKKILPISLIAVLSAAALPVSADTRADNFTFNINATVDFNGKPL